MDHLPFLQKSAQNESMGTEMFHSAAVMVDCLSLYSKDVLPHYPMERRVPNRSIQSVRVNQMEGEGRMHKRMTRMSVLLPSPYQHVLMQYSLVNVLQINGNGVSHQQEREKNRRKHNSL